MKHLAMAAAVAAATAAASALAAPVPTAAAWHPVGPAALPAPAIQRLSDAQLAGQRVIYSYPGLTPPRALLRAVRRGQAAGVIFFAGNISSPAQLAAVARQLQRADASKRNPVRAPLLLMADQEGGAVRRLPGPPDLSERQIGQAADPPGQARQAGLGAAATLLSAGLNVNLAPVLDVYRAAGDFIDQYGRSYSSDPGQVARLGADFIWAQQRAGVAAAAKHFPGLGAAARKQDTDLRPVTLTVPVIDAAPGGRAALPGRDRGRRQAGHGVVGGLPGPRPAPPGRAVPPGGAGRAAAAARLPGSDHHRRAGGRGAAPLRHDRAPGPAGRAGRDGPAAVRRAQRRRRASALRPAWPAPTGTACSAGLPARPRSRGSPRCGPACPGSRPGPAGPAGPAGSRPGQPGAARHSGRRARQPCGGP